MYMFLLQSFHPNVNFCRFEVYRQVQSWQRSPQSAESRYTSKRSGLVFSTILVYFSTSF